MTLPDAIIQKANLTEHHLNSAFWASIVTGVTLACLFAAGSSLIAWFYDEPRLTVITIAISFNFIFHSFTIVQRALFRKNLNFRKIAQVEMVAVTLAGAIAIVFAVRGFGVWSLVANSIANYLMASLLLWHFSSWKPKISFDWKSFIELWNFSSSLLVFNIVSYVSKNLDSVMIGKFLGLVALGVYDRGIGLVLVPMMQLFLLVARVMFPVLSFMKYDKIRFTQVYLRSTRTIALIAFPVLIGLLVTTNSFILSVYGISGM